ncbi:dnaJ-like protein subfamily C member 18 [Platysternon megacephalum]|uniref:DnaJ-like protein subfamily C member 18 n=1 Tax=Platysternon megacephalum TaxID=55544 RepID=A0A4D9F5N5_9SAUR|nr:dnaJ-like protein subfamily C member 18 [Platysternon megacephalum]
MADEAMESYLYSAYTPYSYRYQPPKGKGPPGAWRQRGTYFSGYGDTAAAAAAEYFDNYQRAQLKAILSQVNPSLTPRLRKANTKEVGVQVNPRQDASVQCSLGPRTLLLRRRPAPGLPSLRPREQEQGSPATASSRPVRFPRTIAVYSPMASRRLTTFLEEPEPEDPGQEAAEEPEEAAAEEEEQQRSEAAAVRASWEQPPGSSAEPQEPRPPQQQEVAEEEAAAPRQEGPVEAPERQAGQPQAAAPQEPGQGKTRLRFQFLEQKYGYYHCKDCNIRWESAYVWCVQGTNKVGLVPPGLPLRPWALTATDPPSPFLQVYFRQFCRTCQKSYNPYRVEDITCQSCKQTRCTCPVKVRHVDPKRPHRQDLCGRCKGKRLSCDSTFSFKYII